MGSLWAEIHHQHLTTDTSQRVRLASQQLTLGTVHLPHLVYTSLHTSGYTPPALCTHLLLCALCTHLLLCAHTSYYVRKPPTVCVHLLQAMYTKPQMHLTFCADHPVCSSVCSHLIHTLCHMQFITHTHLLYAQTSWHVHTPHKICLPIAHVLQHMHLISYTHPIIGPSHNIHVPS